ncbi:hypothetical protein G4B88_004661 [Cannabis sativa]|uniref:Uncharacterized protein n=1 Tax=Cannabis sativa TaxID=3483 RepID=A0A7J6FYP6_CANSA|nr:hypothetical protein G4B88_004661 [Cannabis sativa]
MFVYFNRLSMLAHQTMIFRNYNELTNEFGSGGAETLTLPSSISITFFIGPLECTIKQPSHTSQPFLSPSWPHHHSQLDT